MYPVAFASDYAPERSRLTTFLRYFMAIPVAIAGYPPITDQARVDGGPASAQLRGS